MEVIYYMRNYYPLTAAQKMHHNWILDYGTQQVSGVSVGNRAFRLYQSPFYKAG